MPLLSVTAAGTEPDIDETRLNAALDALPAEAPVIVMVHGYKFRPGDRRHCPHRHIMSLDPDPKASRALSWPRQLGVGAAEEPLCIGFGWPARGSIWRAWAEAERAGAALARLMARVAARRGAPARVIAHSLGARVALTGLSRAPEGAVGRVILISGAALRSDAAAALAGPAARTAEVVNVTSRENDLFDALLELLLAARDRAIGAGIGAPARGWLDLAIDDARTRAALEALGHRIAAPDRRICHWSGYLRPGLFPLYRRLLADPEALPLALLRRLLPEEPEPRWSRLLAPPASNLRPTLGAAPAERT
ncbi:Alpha/beta hydrolase of unknown function [Tranquillimonas rosea]|uniref:Alpha/beta hydrolase family protein n=1 Tax=Tranquillimonas rosea TaxID=641238 RepID=A0A1H9WFL7_9RHOB|nr:alpha/beta hydrolase [Tranquillimonas rosea]SES32263.1 Alpha/beta hydrolase of unknown function [Tranquillimonas rosea]